jgi:hypothetical protein
MRGRRLLRSAAVVAWAELELEPVLAGLAVSAALGAGLRALPWESRVAEPAAIADRGELWPALP